LVSEREHSVSNGVNLSITRKTEERGKKLLTEGPKRQGGKVPKRGGRGGLNLLLVPLHRGEQRVQKKAGKVQVGELLWERPLHEDATINFQKIET